MEIELPELFCVKFDEVERSLSTAFKQLRREQFLFDVTVTVRSIKFQAHKVVLSACSDFFKDLFKDNTLPYTYVYLRGVEVPDLRNIMDFMYEGEAKVEKSSLDSFLHCAQDLRIRGLFADEKDEPKSKEGEKKKKIKKRKKKPGETSSPEPAEKIEKKEEVHWMEEGDDGEEDRIEHEPYAEAFLRPQYKEQSASEGSGNDPQSYTQYQGPPHAEALSQELDESETHRLPRGKSWVWNFMGFKEGEPGRVICNLCQKSLAYHQSTSSMISHLRRYHPEETMSERKQSSHFSTSPIFSSRSSEELESSETEHPDVKKEPEKREIFIGTAHAQDYDTHAQDYDTHATHHGIVHTGERPQHVTKEHLHEHEVHRDTAELEQAAKRGTAIARQQEIELTSPEMKATISPDPHSPGHRE